ncbi:MAG: ABC transporter permease [Candidatus Marinimicrobia bacterium]|nr:ABC transporter permease [Candidatus Neomarinimicrobiota bacterium]MBT3632836.1 ABC transporter permease [Candidatus Neomarinimicrobiota bacterium]MBT3681946.1 ABC transporter permease [Candidatus Neomarinimicrobiota bacterium]MBT3759025.1 ABC transporter permease [Candidatus Neomarinimicrobiota bacterium]MBT3895076.1 ABC transporter permease [Candidatus Neomarinimicrobiota bacterium]
MEQSIYYLSIPDLLWIFIPVIVVIFIFHLWNLKISTPIYAMFRMFFQLILIGYALDFIFDTEHPAVVIGILFIMLAAAGLIALRPLKVKTNTDYFISFLSVASGSIPTLIIVIFAVVNLDPWYNPQYLIPLSGMIFANSMNAVSIASERLFVESQRQNDLKAIRATVLQAALIPITNSLFAVGIVSLPGMMTGQILSGTSPLIAVRYQIMVMCMVFGSSGISTAVYLSIQLKRNSRAN